MYLHALRLKNVKGVRNLEWQFQRPDGQYAGVSVILGENASGKTTVLKSIACGLLGPDVSRVLLQTFEGWITVGEGKAEISVEIIPTMEDKFQGSGPRAQRPFAATIRLAGERGEPAVITPRSDAERRAKKKPPALRGPWSENPNGWFSCGYGAFRRLSGENMQAQRLMMGPPRVARHASLFNEGASLGECDLWLRNLHHKALENDKVSDALVKGIIRLLNDDLFPADVRTIKVTSNGLVLQDSAGATVQLKDMSEGYRSVIALIVDIIRQITTDSKRNIISEHKGRIVVQSAGVILIDEVDAHLHPAWQRKIIEWLRLRFPRMQFILTTHSPIIIKGAELNRAFHLPIGNKTLFRRRGHTPHHVTLDDFFTFQRGSMEEILRTEAFGLRHTRPPKVVDAAKRLSYLRAKSPHALSSAERAELLRLEEEVSSATRDFLAATLRDQKSKDS